jgi:hypothetical protein
MKAREDYLAFNCEAWKLTVLNYLYYKSYTIIEVTNK